MQKQQKPIYFKPDVTPSTAALFIAGHTNTIPSGTYVPIHCQDFMKAGIACMHIGYKKFATGGPGIGTRIISCGTKGESPVPSKSQLHVAFRVTIANTINYYILKTQDRVQDSLQRLSVSRGAIHIVTNLPDTSVGIYVSKVGTFPLRSIHLHMVIIANVCWRDNNRNPFEAGADLGGLFYCSKISQEPPFLPSEQ